MQGANIIPAHGCGQKKGALVMKKTIPCLLIVCILSTVYAQYENGGVISAGVYEGYVECRSGLLVVDGGGADIIEMWRYSHLKVLSTSPFIAGYGGIWDIRLYGHMDYFGGQTEELSISGYATANLYGGRIDFISSYQKVFDVIVGWDEQGNPIFNTHIEMFVRDYEYNPTTMRLTGTWGDFTTFNIKLLDQSSDPRFDPAIDNIKFTIIPEPATILLLCFGGLLTCRKKELQF